MSKMHTGCHRVCWNWHSISCIWWREHKDTTDRLNVCLCLRRQSLFWGISKRATMVKKTWFCPDKLTHLADNLINLAGVLQGQVVLRRQAVEVRGALHLAQVLPVLQLQRNARWFSAHGRTTCRISSESAEISGGHVHTDTLGLIWFRQSFVPRSDDSGRWWMKLFTASARLMLIPFFSQHNWLFNDLRLGLRVRSDTHITGIFLGLLCKIITRSDHCREASFSPLLLVLLSVGDLQTWEGVQSQFKGPILHLLSGLCFSSKTPVEKPHWID